MHDSLFASNIKNKPIKKENEAGRNIPFPLWSL